MTGAGSGMERELTIQLLKKGAKVAIADRYILETNKNDSLIGKGKLL